VLECGKEKEKKREGEEAAPILVKYCSPEWKIIPDKSPFHTGTRKRERKGGGGRRGEKGSRYRLDQELLGF